jgi:hypothetical protein
LMSGNVGGKVHVMSDVEPGVQAPEEPTSSDRPAPKEVELGGLHFEASFRKPGATLRVSGPTPDGQKELLRFDDFIESPHYHVPADGDAIMFDRDSHGAPLDWYVGQLRDHLAELLVTAGYSDVLPAVDVAAVTTDAERIKDAMIDCVPEGYVRVPGVGLQRAG